MQALIVDDDTAMSGMISRCLSLWGWMSDQSNSVAQMLLKAKPTLRVVVMSGDPENPNRAKVEGLIENLTKPFEITALKILLDAAREGQGIGIRDVSRSHIYFVYCFLA
jgi:DNA-binding NtrC family response regulator